MSSKEPNSILGNCPICDVKAPHGHSREAWDRYTQTSNSRSIVAHLSEVYDRLLESGRYSHDSSDLADSTAIKEGIDEIERQQAEIVSLGRRLGSASEVVLRLTRELAEANEAREYHRQAANGFAEDRNRLRDTYDKMNRDWIDLLAQTTDTDVENRHLRAGLELMAARDRPEGLIARETLSGRGPMPATETEAHRIPTDAQCDAVLADMADKDWRGLSRSDIRDFYGALDRAMDRSVASVIQCECPIVKCARGCATEGPMCAMVAEEGNEWECPACNERENARERQQLETSGLLEQSGPDDPPTRY